MGNKIEIEFTIESKDAKKNVDRVTKSTAKFEKEAVKNFQSVGRSFDVLKGVLGAAAIVKSFELATAAAGKLFDVFVTQGVAAAQVQEDAINNMNFALKRSGEFSEEASKDIQAWAQALQLTTTIGDEAALQNFALAKSFGFSAAQAKVATEAALELSVAAGISLDEATRRVGRTISGSVEDVSKFAPEIKNLTKAELEAGKAADLLIKALGGTATAQINTFSGAASQLGNTFGDLQETTGALITENDLVLKSIKILNKAFLDARAFVEANEASIQSFISNGLIKVVGATASTITAVDSLNRSFTIGFNAITAAAAGFAIGVLTPLAAVEQGINSLISSIPGLSEKFGEGSNTITNIVDDLKSSVEEDVADIETAFSGTTALSEAASVVEEASRSLIETLNQETEAIKQTGEAAVIAKDKKIEAKIEENDQIKALNEELALAEEEQRLLKEEEETLLKDEDFEKLQETLGTQEALRATARAQAAANLNKDDSVRLKNKKKIIDEENKILAGQTKFQNLSRNEQFSAAQSTSSKIVALTKAAGKENSAIGKAAAIADATIQGVLAVQKALASAPPPLNIVNAAIVGAIAAINVSKIQSSPTFQGGGIVEGNQFSGDNISARVNSGEAILTRRQQTDLFNAIDNNDLSGGGGVNVVVQGNVIGNEEFTQDMITQINDAVEFRNASARFG